MQKGPGSADLQRQVRSKHRVHHWVLQFIFVITVKTETLMFGAPVFSRVIRCLWLYSKGLWPYLGMLFPQGGYQNSVSLFLEWPEVLRTDN